jgi:hypothetical protein
MQFVLNLVTEPFSGNAADMRPSYGLDDDGWERRRRNAELTDDLVRSFFPHRAAAGLQHGMHLAQIGSHI